MKKPILLFIILTVTLAAHAQTFDFTGNRKLEEGVIAVTPDMRYTAERGYGYDFVDAPEKGGKAPFFFSVAVPDGNYRVTLTIGSKRSAGNTTVRGESRRLFFENISTRKGEQKELVFCVNKRTPVIDAQESVRIKDRERGKLNWDDRLTLEINGPQPQLARITIEPADDEVTTVYLCGNSTVVDQDYEPWASWGQMIPRWFDEGVSIANYAESGESCNSFIGAGRLKKILSHLKSGDYLFVEFGHNDQKQKGPGKGAWYNFSTELKTFADEARLRGATIVFVTPTQRRSFDAEGRIQETHGDYPDAMRAVAQREQIPLIELHDMTRTFFETLGVEGSKQALVHYPANTYPNQPNALADNTHFNAYGAYEVARMVAEGIRTLGLPLAEHLRDDSVPFDVAHPDDPATFHWDDSPFIEVQKPDGN